MRSDIATYVPLDGQIAPVQESTLSSQQSGNVAAVYVNEGQHVVRGEVVAKLDDSENRDHAQDHGKGGGIEHGA